MCTTLGSNGHKDSLGGAGNAYTHVILKWLYYSTTPPTLGSEDAKKMQPPK